MRRTVSYRLTTGAGIRTRLESWVGLSSAPAARPIAGFAVALLLGLAALLVAPAISGHLATQDDLLGSLDDRHAQFLLLVVAPALWTGFLWQPRALARIRSALGSPSTAPDGQESPEIMRSLLPIAAVGAALAVIAFDLSHVLPNSGTWWGNAGLLSVTLRELSLGLAIFMMTSLVLRHLLAIQHWRRLNPAHSPANPEDAAAALRRYGWASATLLAAVGSRLVIEAIELPAREGSITPDYFVKIAIYIVAALVLVIVPFSQLLGRLDQPPAPRLSFSLLIGIIALAPPAVGLTLAIVGV